MAVFVTVEETQSADKRLALRYKGLDELEYGAPFLLPWLTQQDPGMTVHNHTDDVLRVSLSHTQSAQLLRPWFQPEDVERMRQLDETELYWPEDIERRALRQFGLHALSASGTFGRVKE